MSLGVANHISTQQSARRRNRAIDDYAHPISDVILPPVQAAPRRQYDCKALMSYVRRLTSRWVGRVTSITEPENRRTIVVAFIATGGGELIRRDVSCTDGRRL